MRWATATSRRRHDEGGFTLLELVIVMVVLGIAMAVIGPAIANMMRGSQRSAAAVSAELQSQFVGRLFEADVRSALGDRTTGDRQDLGADITPATVEALEDGAAASHDVVRAGATRLEVHADVLDSNAGPEHVTWRLVTNNAACGSRSRTTNENWCVLREVRALGGGGGPITAEVVSQGRGPFPIANRCGLGNRAELFCYYRSVPTNAGGAWPTNAWNAWRPGGGWTSNCTEGPNAFNFGAGTGVPFSQWVRTRHHNVQGETGHDTRISRLDTITRIEAFLPSGASFGRASEQTFEQAEVVIRARTSPAYQQAIMCGSRAGWGQ